MDRVVEKIASDILLPMLEASSRDFCILRSVKSKFYTFLTRIGPPEQAAVIMSKCLESRTSLLSFTKARVLAKKVASKNRMTGNLLAAEEVENDPFQSIRIECESESPTVYEEIGRETETELMELANELAEIEEVGRLLQEENDEIETMQRFRDKNIERYSSCEPDKISFSEIVDKINEICGQPVKHRPDDETQTDVAAAMLHLEEKGLKMTSSPAKIFTNLFPVESDVVSLAGTNVEVAEGISIPMSRPMRIVAKGPPYEDAGMIDFIRTDKQFIVPHAPVSAPSSDLPQLLGATNSMIEANRSSSGSKAPNEFQVVLDAIPSARSAHIQMRGSQSPKWFPGYYAILPNNDGIQKYEKPWPVLEKAWKNAVPTRIKPRNNEPIVVGSYKAPCQEYDRRMSLIVTNQLVEVEISILLVALSSSGDRSQVQTRAPIIYLLKTEVIWDRVLLLQFLDTRLLLPTVSGGVEVMIHITTMSSVLALMKVSNQNLYCKL
ncbi:hypothetical protein AAG570_010713 [Ranatra chinensis]|uniref:Uncharacterized protein n=1 Tax=Ranatra chinensis TaxID=642074 RepID=A0ABD0YNE0_9HEMI